MNLDYLILFRLLGVKFSVLKIRTSNYSVLFIKAFRVFLLLILDGNGKWVKLTV